MNNKLLTILKALVFCLLVFAFPQAVAYAAPNVQFNPPNATVVQNTTVSITININVETNSVRSSDVTILYAGADLEVSSVTKGNFFPSFSKANDPSGRLELHGYTASVGDSRTGADTYATIVFKAKKGSGSSTVSFICSGSGQDTNILTVSGQNILSCTQVNQLGVTYSDGSVPTSTPTPGQAGTNTIPTCVMLSSDTSLAVGAPAAVTFTCSGVDPDGYINAAEFTFGDNTSDTVYKNAGSPGSISTKHTYTTIGTLGATCRVRDNNNVFSNASNDCKRIIIINPKTTNAASRTYYQRVIAAEKGDVNPLITPTPEQVAIVYETPTPIVPSISPIPSEQPAAKKPVNILWWILGGLIAILGAVLLLRKKEPPPTAPPPTV
jgi:uncharacterized membrane protein YccF (DUF307 family)